MRVGGKWAWIFGWIGAVAVFVLGAGLDRWPIDPDRVGAELNAAAPGSAMHWARPAKATLKVLPWPTLRITDAELRTPSGQSFLQAPSLEIGLRPEQLLLGRFSAGTGTLTNPTITLDLDAAALDGAAKPPLGPVQLRNGVVKIVSASRGLDTLVQNVDGRFEWSELERPLSLAFTAEWRGRRVSGAGQIDSPLLLTEGEPTGARLTLTSPDADLAFAGTWSYRERSEFDGDLTARVRSRDSLRDWIGVRTPPLIDAQAFAFHGRATGSTASLLLRDARIEIGEQSFEGSLSLARDGGRLSASGTLAADDLDLASLLGPRPALFDAAGEWSHGALVPAPNDALDLDLRVSAARASWSGPAIEDVAVSVLRRDGRLTLKVLEASAYHGALTGEVSVENRDGAPASRATLALDDADCGALLQDLGVPSYSGRCALNAELRATGASPAEIAASAKGAATVELQAGAVAGINFEEALRRSQRRPIEVARDMIAGQTKFAEASARVEISGGEARIAEAGAQGPGAIFEASGTIGVISRDWRVKILATQASGLGEASPDSVRLGFTLSGPWNAPTLAAAGED
jgi:AsmA protein